MLRDDQMRFFGQQLEDKIAWRFFEGETDGFFLDVGAYDGVTFSNTRAFELAGWTGICIEPNPYVFDVLKWLRPNSLCIRAAVSDYTGVAKFNAADTTSRLSPDGPLLVDVITIAQLFRMLCVPKLDYVSIDTEGNDHNVLYGFPFEIYQPRLIVIESGDDLTTKLLKSKGYVMARQHYFNYFYCKSDDVGRFDNIPVQEALT